MNLSLLHHKLSACKNTLLSNKFTTLLFNDNGFLSSKHITNYSPSHYVKSIRWLGHEMDDWRSVVRLSAGELHFAILQSFQIGSASTHSTFQRKPVTLSSGHAVDHSLQCTLKFKNVWSYTPFPSYAFMMWRFIKHREVFIFVDQHAEFSRTGGFSFHLRLYENESEKSVTHGTN